MDEPKDRTGGVKPGTYLIEFGFEGALSTREPGAESVRKGKRIGANRLDSRGRKAVLEGIREACLQVGWTLIACHVRSVNVRAVVEAGVGPGQVTAALKASASRALRRLGNPGAGRMRWSREVSTRCIWTSVSLTAAVDHVLCDQGRAMAVFSLTDRRV